MAETFKLTLHPVEKVLFTGKKLGEEVMNTTIKLTNPLKERIAYKIKCISNDIFRIRPSVGAVKPGETITVTLSFTNSKTIPENGKHYFAFYHIKADDQKKAPRIAWSEYKGDSEGTKKLHVAFKKEGGGLSLNVLLSGKEFFDVQLSFVPVSRVVALIKLYNFAEHCEV